MECPMPDNGYSYGVNCQAVFIRDPEILQDGVYVVTYYFSSDEVHLFDKKRFYDDNLTTVIVSIRQGYVYDIRGKRLYKARYSTRYGSQCILAHIFCCSTLSEAMSFEEGPLQIISMLPLNAEGGKDNLHKACIELHFSTTATSKSGNGKPDIVCNSHEMYPFCTCGFAVGLPVPGDVETFQIYMHLMSLPPEQSYTDSLLARFAEFLEVYEDILHDVFCSFKKERYLIPPAMPECHCVCQLGETVDFVCWDRSINYRIHIQMKNSGETGYIDLIGNYMFLYASKRKFALTYKPFESPQSKSHYKSYFSFYIRDTCAEENYSLTSANGRDGLAISMFTNKRWEYICHRNDLWGFVYRPSFFSLSRTIVHHCNVYELCPQY